MVDKYTANVALASSVMHNFVESTSLKELCVHTWKNMVESVKSSNSLGISDVIPAIDFLNAYSVINSNFERLSFRPLSAVFEQTFITGSYCTLDSIYEIFVHHLNTPAAPVLPGIRPTEVSQDVYKRVVTGKTVIQAQAKIDKELIDRLSEKVRHLDELTNAHTDDTVKYVGFHLAVAMKNFTEHLHDKMKMLASSIHGGFVCSLVQSLCKTAPQVYRCPTSLQLSYAPLRRYSRMHQCNLADNLNKFIFFLNKRIDNMTDLINIYEHNTDATLQDSETEIAEILIDANDTPIPIHGVITTTKNVIYQLEISKKTISVFGRLRSYKRIKTLDKKDSNPQQMFATMSDKGYIESDKHVWELSQDIKKNTYDKKGVFTLMIHNGKRFLLENISMSFNTVMEHRTGMASINDSGNPMESSTMIDFMVPAGVVLTDTNISDEPGLPKRSRQRHGDYRVPIVTRYKGNHGITLTLSVWDGLTIYLNNWPMLQVEVKSKGKSDDNTDEGDTKDDEESDAMFMPSFHARWTGWAPAPVILANGHILLEVILEDLGNDLGNGGNAESEIPDEGAKDKDKLDNGQNPLPSSELSKETELLLPILVASSGRDESDVKKVLLYMDRLVLTEHHQRMREYGLHPGVGVLFVQPEEFLTDAMLMSRPKSENVIYSFPTNKISSSDPDDKCVSIVCSQPIGLLPRYKNNGTIFIEHALQRQTVYTSSNTVLKTTSEMLVDEQGRPKWLPVLCKYAISSEYVRNSNSPIGRNIQNFDSQDDFEDMTKMDEHGAASYNMYAFPGRGVVSFLYRTMFTEMSESEHPMRKYFEMKSPAEITEEKDDLHKMYERATVAANGGSMRSVMFETTVDGKTINIIEPKKNMRDISAISCQAYARLSYTDSTLFLQGQAKLEKNGETLLRATLDPLVNQHGDWIIYGSTMSGFCNSGFSTRIGSVAM